MQVVSAKIAAEYLGIKENTIKVWARKAFIPHYRIGRNVFRYNIDHINSWLDANYRRG